MTTDPREEVAALLGLEHAPPVHFASPADVAERLVAQHYLSDDAIASVTFLADRLAKPVLVEGPAGDGQDRARRGGGRRRPGRGSSACSATRDSTSPRRSTSGTTASSCCASRPARTEGQGAEEWSHLEEDIFSDEFLLTRPLLEAITATDPVVLLIDEVDRVELETEALLLEILSEYQVSIPELGTQRARQIPLVFLTSNNTRELSEALKRRCLYLHIGYPTVERERDIIVARVPGISRALAEQIARVVRSLRGLDLKKAPSVSETLDWARTLVVLGREEIGDEDAAATLHILLKYQSDIDRATKELLGGPRTVA